MSTVSHNKNTTTTPHHEAGAHAQQKSGASAHESGVGHATHGSVQGQGGEQKVSRQAAQPTNDKFNGKEAIGAKTGDTGWQKSQIDGGEAGGQSGEHVSGGSPETLGVPTSPAVRDGVKQLEKQGMGKWLNEQYAAGNKEVVKFVDSAVANKLDAASLNRPLENAADSKNAAAAEGRTHAAAEALKTATGDSSSKLATGTAASFTAPAESGGTGTAGGDSGGATGDESFAAKDMKRLMAAFQDATTQRSIDDMGKGGEDDENGNKKAGKKTGGGASKAGAGAAGGAGTGAGAVTGAGADSKAAIDSGGGTGDLGSSTGDGSGSTGSGINSDGSGESVTSSSGQGMGGLSGMELVQAVMLEAAAEAGKSAESLAKVVQQNTAAKNKLRTEIDGYRATVNSTPATSMNADQQSANTKMEKAQSDMDAIGDDNQILFIKLQNASQQYQTMLQGVSNVSKNLFDINKAVVGNIGH